MTHSDRLKRNLLGMAILTCICTGLYLNLSQHPRHTMPVSAAGSPTPWPSAVWSCPPYNLDCNIGYMDPILCECVTPTPGPTPTPPPPTATPLAYGPKGIGDPWQNWQAPNPGTNIDALDFDWYYDWRVSYVPARETDPRYVRTVWCWQSDTSNIVTAASADFANGIRGRVWLVLNEPDHPTGQCGAISPNDLSGTINENPEYAARYFSDIYDMIKSADPHARVFGGGLVFLNTQEAQNWWQDFVSTLQADSDLYKLEGVHVHLYPLGTTSPEWTNIAYTECDDAADGYCVPALAQVANQWYQDMHVGLGLGDRPIWITEMGRHCYGGATSTSWVRDNAMIPMAQWFAQDPAWPYSQVALNPGYDAVSWFATYFSYTGTCHRLLDSLGSSGTPTVLGQFWNSYQP